MSAILGIIAGLTYTSTYFTTNTGDNIVDVEDVNAVINIILKVHSASYYPGISDLNNDGTIDVEDVNAIINIILSH